jgi:hypothetical protein
MQLRGAAIAGGEVKDLQILQCLAWLANRLRDEAVRTCNPDDVPGQDELKGNLDKLLLAVLDYQGHLAPAWALKGAAALVRITGGLSSGDQVTGPDDRGVPQQLPQLIDHEGEQGAAPAQVAE